MNGISPEEIKLGKYVCLICGTIYHIEITKDGDLGHRIISYHKKENSPDYEKVIKEWEEIIGERLIDARKQSKNMSSSSDEIMYYRGAANGIRMTLFWMKVMKEGCKPLTLKPEDFKMEYQCEWVGKDDK